MAENPILTCTSIDCPERKSICCGVKCRGSADDDKGFFCSACKKPFQGGKCIASEKIDQLWYDNWEKVFDMFTKGDDSLGSAGWMVAPSTVKNFIKGLLENRKIRIIEQLQNRLTTAKKVCSGGFQEAIEIVRKEL